MLMEQPNRLKQPNRLSRYPALDVFLGNETLNLRNCFTDSKWCHLRPPPKWNQRNFSPFLSVKISSVLGKLMRLISIPIASKIQTGRFKLPSGGNRPPISKPLAISKNALAPQGIHDHGERFKASNRVANKNSSKSACSSCF